MPTLQEQIQAIQDRYRPQIEDLKRRAQQVVDDYEKPSSVGPAIGVDFKIDWKDVEIIFDVPSVTMKETRISLDIPEIFSESQTIIFHTPSIRMVDRKVGEYPEWHGLRVVWKPIIISVPETFMEEQRIVFDLPSVTMKRHDWKIDIPEFAMERVRWVIGLPQFTVINVRAETAEMQQKGERLKAEGAEIGARMKSEINAVISGMKAASSQEEIGVKNEAIAVYDSAIAKVTTSINELVARGIDPIKVPTESGDINLRKQLADLVAKRTEALQRVDNNISGA
jgi:hypothetical protein